MRAKMGYVPNRFCAILGFSFVGGRADKGWQIASSFQEYLYMAQNQMVYPILLFLHIFLFGLSRVVRVLLFVEISFVRTGENP